MFPSTIKDTSVSDRPASGGPQQPDRPAGDDQPADDAWPAPTQPTPMPTEAMTPEPDAAPRLPPPPGAPPADPNTVAIEHAGVSQETAGWLRQVADQVEPRLDRISSGWRQSTQAGAARACAFGLLLGYLARLYPHARADLGRAAEAHPSYSTLQSGNRLQTLEQISADPQRMAAWLGPLIDVSDPQRMQALLD